MYSFVSGCKRCQYCSICSVPLTVIKFVIIFMFVDFLNKKLFQSYSTRTGFTSMHDAFVALRFVNNFLNQVFASTSNIPFWWALQTKTEWAIFEPARTHHLGLKAQSFQKPIFKLGCFSLKALYNSCKIQRLFQVAKFLFMYSFTHTNIVLLFRHLPTYWDFHLHKRLLPNEVFQWWQFFL